TSHHEVVKVTSQATFGRRQLSAKMAARISPATTSNAFSASFESLFLRRLTDTVNLSSWNIPDFNKSTSPLKE
ncbi:hypothetical protein CCACVL1_21425, partial [Corchorus capsularis]